MTENEQQRGAVAIGMTLILPRGLWGGVLERFYVRLLPVGYTLRQLGRSQAPRG